MPQVVFVNEHRVVDAEAGARLSDVAARAGVVLSRAQRGQRPCRGLGVCRTCRCWVEEVVPGAAGPRTFIERLRGLRGWQRLACRARLRGDVRVFTMPAAANRVGVAREIAPPPAPTVDPSATRKAPDAASTAEFTKGHPSMVGRGGADLAEEAPPDTSRDPTPPPAEEPAAAPATPGAGSLP